MKAFDGGMPTTYSTAEEEVDKEEEEAEDDVWLSKKSPDGVRISSRCENDDDDLLSVVILGDIDEVDKSKVAT